LRRGYRIAAPAPHRKETIVFETETPGAPETPGGEPTPEEPGGGDGGDEGAAGGDEGAEAS
jgi:hypothetical protein